MIIGACGYGATGSSAIYDLIRECDDVQGLSIDSEFKYTYKIDGLQDLKFHLCDCYSKTSSGDAAIRRFIAAAKFAKVPFMKRQVPQKAYLKLTEEYVNQIVQGSFVGIENYDYENFGWWHNVMVLAFKKVFIRKLEKYFGIRYNAWPLTILYISIEPDNFMEKSKEYIRNLLSAMGFDLNGNIILNQPFEGNFPENSFPYFDDPKAIIVDRDPRDVFIAHQKIYSSEGRFVPRDDVKTFVLQYRLLRNKGKQNTPNKLYVQFEDLVYEYEKTRDIVFSFLGLEHNHPLKYFNPKRSINNTQLWLKYTDLSEDIKYIESELSEYLYDFSKYGEIEHKGKVF